MKVVTTRDTQAAIRNAVAAGTEGDAAQVSGTEAYVRFPSVEGWVPTADLDRVATLIPAFGCGHLNDHWDQGPADWLDPSQFPKAPVPWTNYHDAANGIVAASNNGVEPSAAQIREMNLFGNRTWLYSPLPLIKDGVHGFLKSSAGDNFININTLMAEGPSPTGVRGKCALSPYIMWRGHPTVPGNLRSPLYDGMDPAGRVFYAMAAPVELVYAGTVPGCNGAHDFAHFEPDRAVFFVADTGNGRILKVDRTAANAARPPGQLADPALWVTTTLVGGFIKPTSIETLKDGRMFVCDEGASKLVQVDPFTGARVREWSVPSAFWVRRMSTSEVVVASLYMKTHIVDPASTTLGANIMPTQWVHTVPIQWVNFSVDEFATWGPKDVIRMTQSHGNSISANVGFWRFYDRGATVNWGRPWGGNSVTGVGDSSHGGEWFHYGWTCCHHPDQGLLLTQGTANSMPMIVRAKRANDPAEEPHDHTLYGHGIAVVKTGTTRAYQLAHGTWSRPSFMALLEQSGWGLLMTCDWMVQEAKAKGWAWLNDFIQSGMGGTTPRPEIVGRDMYALMYWICKCSQQYLNEGGALIASMKAFVVNWYGAGALTATTAAIAPKCDGSETFLCATVVGSNIVIQGRDWANDPRSVPATTVVDLVIDEGRPGEKRFALSSPWTMPIPALPPGPHAMTCRHPTLLSQGSVVVTP